MEEEREKELEELYDQNMKIDQKNSTGLSATARTTIESLKNCDKVIDAIEMGNAEDEIWKEYNECISKGLSMNQPPINPYLQRSNKDNITPGEYILDIFEKIPPADLEAVLLVLPFKIVLSLLKYLDEWFQKNHNVTLCCKILHIILNLHYGAFSTSKDIKVALESIMENAKKHITCLQNLFLFNHAALCYMKQVWELEHCSSFFDEAKVNELRSKNTKKVEK